MSFYLFGVVTGDGIGVDCKSTASRTGGSSPSGPTMVSNRINLGGKISLLTMQRFHFGKILIWELNRLMRFALLAQ